MRQGQITPKQGLRPLSAAALILLGACSAASDPGDERLAGDAPSAMEAAPAPGDNDSVPEKPPARTQNQSAMLDLD